MTKEEFFKIYYNCTPKDFDWTNNSWELIYYYRDEFDIWWNPDKFYWEKSFALCQYHHYNFYKWWDPDKFNWEDIEYLYKHCSEYKDIWISDYLLRKIL